MPKQSLTVNNRLGLHARVAYRFVEVAVAFEADVVVSKNGNRKNGKEIMDLLSLSAGKGDELIICTTGQDAKKALDELSSFMELLTDDD